VVLHGGFSKRGQLQKLEFKLYMRCCCREVIRAGTEGLPYILLDKKGGAGGRGGWKVASYACTLKEESKKKEGPCDRLRGRGGHRQSVSIWGGSVVLIVNTPGPATN